jgi:predicted nucleic acid-binding protein
MMTVVLLDANVLVYALDSLAGKRHRLARDIVASLGGTGAAVSTQVLSEYANVATHPNKLAMRVGPVAASVRRIEVDFSVIQVTAETVVRALEARARWQLSYYQAQIWASAALASIPAVLSEDFSDGLELGPVRFVNPFSEGFDVTTLPWAHRS